MENVYLIGDSHALRVYESHDLNSTTINFKAWGKGGADIYNFNALGLQKGKIVSDDFETTLPQNWDGEKLSFNNITDDGLILAWFGYIDVKRGLPKYDDADEIAKRYIKNLKETFWNSKIRIIEPHPQFIEIIERDVEEYPAYDYELRSIQNKKLCDALRKYSLELGLGPTITQEQIYEAIGLEKITVNEAFQKDVDGLRYKYKLRIYNLFIDEIYKTLGIR